VTTLRSLHAIAIPSVVCLSSVCLSSVTLVRPTQPVEIFGNYFSPYDSSGILVFWCQKSLVGGRPFPPEICVQSDPAPLFDNTSCKSIRLALDEWKVHRSIRNWITTMHAHRTILAITETFSIFAIVSCGLPQGGGLSPILWSLTGSRQSA